MCPTRRGSRKGRLFKQTKKKQKKQEEVSNVFVERKKGTRGKNTSGVLQGRGKRT